MLRFLAGGGFGVAADRRRLLHLERAAPKREDAGAAAAAASGRRTGRSPDAAARRAARPAERTREQRRFDRADRDR